MGTFETESEILKQEGGDEKKALLTKWLAEIDLYEKDKCFTDWHEACKKVDEAYILKASAKSKYSFLWVYLETMKPTIFFQVPKVEVDRRRKDKDPIARAASEILERTTQYSLDAYCLFKDLIDARDDFLKYNRAVTWESYKFESKVIQEPVPVMLDAMQQYVTQEGLPVDPMQVQFDQVGNPFILNPVEVKVNERIETDYLDKDQFGHTIAKKWKDVKAVWKIAYLTREECIKAFGEEVGRNIKLDHIPKNVEEKDEATQAIFKKAKVYEIWDKTTKKVIWLSKSYTTSVLKVDDDPLNLKNFFPCAIIYGTTHNKSLAPQPDYMQYKNLIDDFNDLNNRIAKITKAVKAAGLYDSLIATDLSKIAADDSEIALHAVNKWATHVNKNGLKGAIDWFPIQEIAAVLRYLYESQAAKKQELFEVTGQSDLMRGMTNPNETATAQNLKSEYGNQRLKSKQRAFQEFIREIIEIKAEIIAELFDDNTIREMAMVDNDQEMATNFDQALALLRNEPIRNYRIDIETDSTLAGDDIRQQEQAVQFVNVITQGLNDTLPYLQGYPQLAPLVGEVITFISRRFRAGRTMESVIETAMENIANPQMPPQPQPGQGEQAPGVDASIIASQNEQESRQMQAQMEAQWRNRDLALREYKVQNDVMLEAEKLKQAREETQAKLKLEAMRTGADIGLGL